VLKVIIHYYYRDVVELELDFAINDNNRTYLPFIVARDSFLYEIGINVEEFAETGNLDGCNMWDETFKNEPIAALIIFLLYHGIKAV